MSSNHLDWHSGILPNVKRGVLASVAGLLLGCPPPTAPDAEPTAELGPGPMLPMDSHPSDFMWEQRVRIEWNLGDDGFDAVLQKSESVLSLIGLGPMQRPAFVITATDEGVTLENNSPHELPFDPGYIVADVQRVFYPWFDGPAASDGARSRAIDGGTVSEVWVDGCVMTRVFTRDDAPEREPVEIDIEGCPEPGRPATRATLRNGWFGYELTVETLREHALD